MHSNLYIFMTGLFLVGGFGGTALADWVANPYLLLDKRRILSVDNLRRQVNSPVRYGEALVDGEHDQNYQPYVTVIRDPETHRFRNADNTPVPADQGGGSKLALIESDDGIHWIRPHKICNTSSLSIGVGASVIDEGPEFSDQAHRFKYAWWHGGLEVAGSADGFNWELLEPEVGDVPVVKTNHDITALDWDPIRRRYMAFLSVATTLNPSWSEGRRIPHQSVSEDLKHGHWREPWLIIQPDPASPREQGTTQFYCMAGVLARGDLLVGLLKVLRDDLNAEVGLNAAELRDDRPFGGLGYTVLVWSGDGEHWNRDTEPFLDRNPQPGTWDRAHAWADDQIIVGDELYIYYGGYRFGHKADRYTTRQIGLARLPRDRYVGWTADTVEGHLRTTVAPLHARAMTLNAKVEGELRVRVCDPTGKVIPGFDFDDCAPISGDALAHPVRWTGSLDSLAAQPVQFVFTLRNGSIFSFDLHDATP